jgi:hypothetical protein
VRTVAEAGFNVTHVEQHVGGIVQIIHATS